MNTIRTAFAAVAGLALLFASPASANASPGPALWKLADEDTTIYLFGTVHILPKGRDWLTPTIDQALDGADVLITEIPSGPASDVEADMLVKQKGMLAEGLSVRSLLNPDELEIYEEAMGKLGMPVDSFDAYKPWIGALNFSLLPSILAGYSPDHGVEEVLEREAGPNLARGSLETLEFQFSIFDNLPLDQQIDFLITSAESVDEAVPMLDTMVDEWIEGDAEGLAILMNEGFEDDPLLAEKLLYDRNANWAEWIDQRMDEPGTVFIAVGAGHLAGEKSVQDLLEHRGFTITRVQ